MLSRWGNGFSYFLVSIWMNLINFSLIEEILCSGLEMTLNLMWEMLMLLQFLVVLDEQLVIRYGAIFAKFAQKL